MAHQLRREGKSVPVLILLDDYAPGHPQLPPFFVRALLHVREAVKLGPLQMWPYLIKYTMRLKRLVVEVQPKLYEGLREEHAGALMTDLNRGAQIIFRASKQYRLQHYPGCLAVITAEDISEFGIGAFDDDPTRGWKHWAADARFAGSLPCAHTNMLDVEHAAGLAGLLAACLDLGSESAA